MPETLASDRGRTSDTYRLRRGVYDDLIRQRGATTINEQVRLTGVTRATLYRILGGSHPSFASAMKISDALGVQLNVLFERVEDAA